MKLKLKHVRHPLRTAVVAGRAASIYLDMRKFGARSQRRFRDDPRFDLDNVSRGFAPRLGVVSDDAGLLARICSAYNKAAQDERDAPKAYRATVWWQQIRRERLGPVIQALETCNVDVLGRMYRNFFRDACSSGLVGVPYGMAALSGGRARDMHRRIYLGDALHRIDYWTAQTGGRFLMRDLAGPGIGNPFGVQIGRTLVRTGAPYQHYSARRVIDCLDSGTGTVAEIGGGFGGMAWYLLRDQPGVKYIDFDVPESLALASYYLIKALPQLNFLLYGENETAPADVVLLPVFALDKMPRASVDVTFSSHAISDLSDEAMGNYLDSVARFTKGCFLYIGDRRAAESISRLAAQGRFPFQLAETRASGWHAHTQSDEHEIECLYQAGSHPRFAAECAEHGLAQASSTL